MFRSTKTSVVDRTIRLAVGEPYLGRTFQGRDVEGSAKLNDALAGMPFCRQTVAKITSASCLHSYERTRPEASEFLVSAVRFQVVPGSAMLSRLADEGAACDARLHHLAALLASLEADRA